MQSKQLAWPWRFSFNVAAVILLLRVCIAKQALASDSRRLQGQGPVLLSPDRHVAHFVPSVNSVEIASFSVVSPSAWTFDSSSLPACLVAQRPSPSSSTVSLFGRAAEQCPAGWNNVSIPVFRLDEPSASLSVFAVSLFVEKAVLLLPKSEAVVQLPATHPVSGHLAQPFSLLNTGSVSADLSWSITASPPASACSAHLSATCVALSNAAVSVAAAVSTTVQPGGTHNELVHVDVPQALAEMGASMCGVAWLLLESPAAAIDTLNSASTCASRSGASGMFRMAVPVFVSNSHVQVLPRAQSLSASIGDLLTAQVMLLLPDGTPTARPGSVQILGWSSSQPWLQLLQPVAKPLSGSVGALSLLLQASVTPGRGVSGGPGMYGAALQLGVGLRCTAAGVCAESHNVSTALFVRVFSGAASSRQSSIVARRSTASRGALVTGAVILRNAAGTVLEPDTDEQVHVQAILQRIATTSPASESDQESLQVFFLSHQLAQVATRAEVAANAPGGISDAAFMQALQAAVDGLSPSAASLVATRPRSSGSLVFRAALGPHPLQDSGTVAVSPAECAASSNLQAAPRNIGGCVCSAGTQPDFQRLQLVGWTPDSDPWLLDAGTPAASSKNTSGSVSMFHILSPAVPCTLCPAGTYRPPLTPDGLSAPVPLRQLQCMACPAGSFSAAGASSCLPCPEQGASCAGGVLRLFPGYWSAPKDSADVPPAIIKCVNLNDCQPAPAAAAAASGGGTLGERQHGGGNADALVHAKLARMLQSSPPMAAPLQGGGLATCRAGHTGVLCRTCTTGRTLAFGQCLECPTPLLAQAYIAAAFLLLVVVPLAAVVLACHHRPCGCGPSAGQAADHAEWHRAAYAKERKLRARKRAARAKRAEGRKDRRQRDAEAEVTDDESSGDEREGGSGTGKGGKGGKKVKKAVDTSIVRIIKPASEMRDRVVPPGHGKRAGLRAPRRDAWDEKQRTKGQRGCRGRTRNILRGVFCCSYADGNDETPGVPGCWGCRPCCGRVACRVIGDTSISGRHFLAVGPRNHTTYYVHESGQVDDVLAQLRMLWQWLSGALLLLLFVDVAAPASVARSASLASGLLDAIAVSVSPQTWPWGCAIPDSLREDLALPIPAEQALGTASESVGNATLAGNGEVVAWADSYESLQTAYGAPIFFAISVSGAAVLACLVGSARVQRHVSDLRSIAVWMSPQGPRAVIDASRVPPRRCGCGPGQSLVPCCTKPLDAPPPAPLDENAPGLSPAERARRKRANAAAYNPHTGARLIRSDDIPTGQRSGTVIGHSPNSRPAKASPRRGTVVQRAAAKASAAATATREAVGLWCTGLFRVPSASNGMLVALLALALVNAPVLRGAAMVLTRLPQSIGGTPRLRYAPELSADSAEHTAVVLSSSALAVLLLLLVPAVVYVLAFRAHTVLSRSRYRLYGPEQRFEASWQELHAPPPVVPLKTRRQVGPDGKMVTIVTPQWGFIQPGSIWRRAPLSPVPAAAWYHIAYVLSPLLAGLHENTVISWQAYDREAAAAGLEAAGLLDDRARPWTHRRSGRLRRTLRAPRFWWLLLESARPVLIGAFGVIGESQDKLLALCLLCFGFLALHVAVFPYATRRQNLLAAGHLSTWLLLCMALQYTNARDLRDAVVALSQGHSPDAAQPAQGVSENDALSRDTTISILSFVVIALWGAATLGSLLVAVFRLAFWPAVRARYQWSITPGNRRYSFMHVLFRLVFFGLRDPLRLRYPPSLEQTREAALRAQQSKPGSSVAAGAVEAKQGATHRQERTASDVRVANPILVGGGLASLQEGGDEGGYGDAKGSPTTAKGASSLSPNLASTLRPADPTPQPLGGTPPRAQIRPPSGKAPPALGSTRQGSKPARQARTPQPVQVGTRQVSTATVRRVSTFGGAGSSIDPLSVARSVRTRRMSVPSGQALQESMAEHSLDVSEGLHSSDDDGSIGSDHASEYEESGEAEHLHEPEHEFGPGDEEEEEGEEEA